MHRVTALLIALLSLLAAGNAWAQFPSNPKINSLTLIPGAAPASPDNGQVWMTSAGLFAEVAGVTVGPFGGGGSGSVSTVSVAAANGFAGTVATPTTTPTITISTSITGLLKGNGTALGPAAAGTDYLAPAGSGAALTGLLWSQIGSTPTTLSGYGITNGAIGASSSSANDCVKFAGTDGKTLADAGAACGSSGGITWPASGDVVISNGTSTPGGVAPSGTDCLVSSGGSWVPAACPGGSGITQLTGDVTAGPGSGSQAATLANTAVAPGTYGSETAYAAFTVSAQGRLNSAGTYALPVVYTGNTLTCNSSGAAAGNTSALNTLLAAGNSHIILPPCANLYFNGTLTMNAPNTWLEGQGQEATVLNFIQAAGDLIVIGNGTTIAQGERLSNLQVYASTSRTGGDAIHEMGEQNTQISYIYLGGSIYNGLVKDGSSDAGDFANYVDHVRTLPATYCQGACLSVGPGSVNSTNPVQDYWVSDGYFGGGFNGTAIDVKECSGCYFVDVNGVQALFGLLSDPGSGQLVYMWNSHTILDGNVDYGFYPNPATGGVIGKMSLGDVWISYTGMVPGHTNSTADGAYLAGAGGGVLRGLSADGCDIRDNAAHGVNTDGTGAVGASFMGCRIGGNSQSNFGGSAVPNVQLGGGSHYEFSGGAIGGAANNLTEQANYGLACSGADYIIVQGVDLTGNNTGELSCSPTHGMIGNNL